MTDYPTRTPAAPAPGALESMPLCHPKEAARFYLCLAFSLLVYGAAACGIAAMVMYETALIGVPVALAVLAGVAWIVVVVAEAFFVTHVRGNGLMVSQRQLPRLYEAVRRAAAVLRVPVPEVYVVQFGKVREAMARFFVRSRLLVLSSALVEDCGEGPELDAAVGRELGHFRFHHQAWRFWLFPAMILPLLYPAYRRATRYTADRCGLLACADPAAAERSLFILAAGGRMGRQVNPAAYGGQVSESGGFWMTLQHLLSAHPTINWRASELLRALPETGAAAPAPRKSALATVLCCFVPGGLSQASGGHGIGGFLAFMVILGVLAGLMASAMKMALMQARQARSGSDLHMLSSAIRAYATDHDGCLPATFEELLREARIPRSMLNESRDEKVMYLVEMAMAQRRERGVEPRPPVIHRLRPDTALLIQPKGDHVWMAFADGNVRLVPHEEFERLIQPGFEDLYSGMSP